MKKRTSKILLILLTILIIGVIIILCKIFSNKTNYNDIEVRKTNDYIQYKLKSSDDWNNLIKINTIVGKNGKEIEITKDDKYIKWKYTNEKKWVNLVDLDSLIGKNGNDGKEIEVSTNKDYVVYKYKGDTEWTKLVKISSLKGQDGSNGKEIEIIKDETSIKWKYKGSDNWNNLIDLSSLKGVDGTDGVNGKDIEIDNDGVNIKWKYKNSEDWNTLTSIDDLKGDKGDKGETGEKGIDGREIELLNDGVNIKWRYKDSENDYTNLIEVEALKGQDGLAWINLGEVDVSNYCKTISEGTKDEYEECGVYQYLSMHFPEAEQGNYIFIDSDDQFMWHVKVEKGESYGAKFALIEYWSTEEVTPYIIKAYLWEGETEWETHEISYLTSEYNDYYNNKFTNIENNISKTKEEMENEIYKVNYNLTTCVQVNFNSLETTLEQSILDYFKTRKFINTNNIPTCKVFYDTFGYKSYKVFAYSLGYQYNGVHNYIEYYSVESPEIVKYITGKSAGSNLNNIIDWGEWKTKINKNDITELQAENNKLKQQNEELKIKINELEDEISKITEVKFYSGTISRQLEEYFSNVSKMPIKRLKYYNFVGMMDVENYFVKVVGTDNNYVGFNYIEYYLITKPNEIWVGYGTINNSTNDITWTWNKKTDIN